MPRVMVFWSRAHHLSREEAERWARAQARALLADDAVRSAELMRLESASPRLGSDWDWLLELEITAPAHECLERGPCAEWLGDLRLLGMQPVVMVVAGAVGLEAEDD